ncbi:cysteine hydrolase family protein [Kitasatospora sp. NPDC058965]|uniref:cysteine hydrolase family protein n=1 Tax=Kitasatospora sp. NPDC058965 TaxID=3346682 RepID=UPI0036B290B7
MTTSWLAVIDLQRLFAEPDSPWFTPGFSGITGTVGELLPVFGPRTVFTRFVAPQTPLGAWNAYYTRWPFALQPPDAPAYRLVREFEAVAGPTVDATTFSKWTPELTARVRDADRLYLAGVTTDCCVLSTALAAADAGISVRIVTDACAGVDDDSHRAALRVLGLCDPLIRLVTAAEVRTELLAETAGRAAPLEEAP